MAISDKRKAKLKDILGDKTGWGQKTGTTHPGRTTYTKGDRTVVVGREGRIRSDSAAGGLKPPDNGPPRQGSEGRKWGAFVNTTEGARAGKRYNVVTRAGKQYNVYADGTAVPTVGSTKDMTRAKGYRDVNENTGRSGTAGGGRQDWTPPPKPLDPTGTGPTQPAPAPTSTTPPARTTEQTAADAARDKAWDERIKAARERRAKLARQNAR